MRVTLVGPTVEENLAIAYLAGALDAAAHATTAVSFVNDCDHARVAQEILATRPELVGLSMSFQSRARGFAALVADLRGAGFAGHIVAGGHFASTAADRLLDEVSGIDSVLCGEAEESLVALADGLAAEEPIDRVPGVVVRGHPNCVRGPKAQKPQNLDRLPAPMRSGPPRTELTLTVSPLVASRGCRAGCAYCSIATFGRLSHGPARRERSPEHIAEEMAHLWRSAGARVFVFHDDDFVDGRKGHDLERLDRLGAALAAKGVPAEIGLTVKARPDHVDAEVVQRLVDLGLVQVVLGVDNHSPKGLRSLGRGITQEQNLTALGILHQAGLAVGSNLLLWEPDTTLEDLGHNLDLMGALPRQVFNLARTEPYQGAPITRRLERQGRLLGDPMGGYYYQLADPRVELAWRVFLETLEPRCYPADSLINQAFRLDWHARLLLRLFPSPRSADLAEQAAQLTTRIAGSTRSFLARIVDFCGHVRLNREGTIQDFCQETGLEVRAEDARLGTRATTLLLDMEACARSWAPEKTRTRRSRAPARAAVAAAAALTIGPMAVQAQPHAQPTPSPVDRRVKEKGQPAGDYAPGEFPAETVWLREYDTSYPDCRGCSHAVGSTVHSWQVVVDVPKGHSFHRFGTTAGQVRLQAVSPDGRRAVGMLSPARNPGTYAVITVFKRNKDGVKLGYRTSYTHNPFGGGCQPGPCSDPAGPRHGYPEMRQCESQFIAQKGKLVFSTMPYGSQPRGIDWPRLLVFGVGLSTKTNPEEGADGNPTVTCTTGRAYVEQPDPRDNCMIGGPGVRGKYRVVVDLVPDTESKRMKAGKHKCTVSFKLSRGEGKRVRTVKASLPFRIDAKGNLHLKVPKIKRSPNAVPPGVGPSYRRR